MAADETAIFTLKASKTFYNYYKMLLVKTQGKSGRFAGF